MFCSLRRLGKLSTVTSIRSVAIASRSISSSTDVNIKKLNNDEKTILNDNNVKNTLKQSLDKSMKFNYKNSKFLTESLGIASVITVSTAGMLYHPYVVGGLTCLTIPYLYNVIKSNSTKHIADRNIQNVNTQTSTIESLKNILNITLKGAIICNMVLPHGFIAGLLCMHAVAIPGNTFLPLMMFSLATTSFYKILNNGIKKSWKYNNIISFLINSNSRTDLMSLFGLTLIFNALMCYAVLFCAVVLN